MSGHTVKWFTVNASLPNQEIASRLAHGVTPKSENSSWIFLRGEKSVACRPSPDILKIDLGEQELIEAARGFAQELGES